MTREAASKMRLIRYLGDQTGERRRQRLKEDLGLDDEAVEVIIHLCNQVTALQARLREMESMVETYQAEHGDRLARYRRVYYEATWEET